MIRTSVFSLVFAMVVSHAFAGEFETANQCYDQERFAEAKQRYEQLVARGEWGANLFYNLGNTEFRLGSSGRAILNYERALALEAGHPEARANLGLLRDRSGSRVRAERWPDLILPKRATTTMTLLAMVGGWAAVFCVAFAVTGHGRATGLWWGAVGSLLVVGVAASALWWSHGEQAQAIVVAEKAEARLAPTDTAAVAELLPAGSEVRVLSERGQWTYCELPGKSRGWLNTRSIERVKLASS